MNDNLIIKHIKINLVIYVTVCAIFLINMGLNSFLKANSVEGETLTHWMIRDIGTLLIALMVGKSLTAKIHFPYLWKRQEDISMKKQVVNLIAIGTLLSILTFINNRFFTDSTISWISSVSNIKEVLLISLKAGIQEEILFRLFIFSLVTFLASKKIHSQKYAIIIGAIISSFLFGLIHLPYIVYPTLAGLVLSFVYYKNGLVPVIIIHSLVNIFHLTLFLMFPY